MTLPVHGHKVRVDVWRCVLSHLVAQERSSTTVEQESTTTTKMSTPQTQQEETVVSVLAGGAPQKDAVGGQPRATQKQSLGDQGRSSTGERDASRDSPRVASWRLPVVLTTEEREAYERSLVEAERWKDEKRAKLVVEMEALEKEAMGLTLEGKLKDACELLEKALAVKKFAR